MNLVSDWAIISAGIVCSMLFTYGCLRIAEMIAPRSQFASSTQFRSIRFWPYYIAASALCAIGGNFIYGAIHLSPLISIRGQTLYEATGLGAFNYVLWPILNLILVDFFHYWKHRAEHRFFWKFHAVHHSIENLSAVNSYHHWSDPLFSLVLATIPMAVVVGIDTPTYAVLTVLIGAQGPFIHSNTRLHLGPMARVLVDNRFHRVHHSIEPGHFHRNFGERSTIWDQIFRTAYFPQDGEWPSTGLANEPEPSLTSDYFWRPFKRSGSGRALASVPERA